MKKSGRDLRYTLVEWTGGQENAERLSSQILRSEKYESVDPIHPLGGPDGTKDLKCSKDGLKYVCGCFFPRGQKSFSVIKNKFKSDLKGVSKNNVDGFIFITNQEISDNKRKELESLAKHSIHIFHLERIIDILNSPYNFGVRLDLLDIDMTKEDLVSFFATQTEVINGFQKTLDVIAKGYDTSKTDDTSMEYTRKESKVKILGSIINKGDVYIADLGNMDNVEHSRIRPVVIVSNQINNKFAPTVTIVPITNLIKKAQLPTQVELNHFIYPERKSVILTEQIKTISKQRLSNLITTLDNETIEKVNKAIKIQLAIE